MVGLSFYNPINYFHFSEFLHHFCFFAENVLCGPITCQLNLTSMCFFTTKVTHDSKNGTYLTTCGTCLMANGMAFFSSFSFFSRFKTDVVVARLNFFCSAQINLHSFHYLNNLDKWICLYLLTAAVGTTLRESCNTEPETVGNVTNSVAVGITNQTLNTDRMKQTLSAVLMSEMAQANGNPANGIPAYGPSVSYTTPPTPYGQGGPVIVVQPPAQQIYFGNGPFDGTLLNRPPRSPNAG